MNRSGSNIILETLRNGVNLTPINKDILYENSDDEDSFKSKISSDNFVIYLHYNYLNALHKKLRNLTNRNAGLYALLRDVAPDIKFIYTWRINKVRQAISMRKTQHTGIYNTTEVEVVECPEILNKITDDEISWFIRWIGITESCWEEFFRTNSIDPYMINYEEIQKDYRQVLMDLYRYLGVLVRSDAFSDIPFLKLSDVHTERRYHEYLKRNY